MNFRMSNKKMLFVKAFGLFLAIAFLSASQALAIDSLKGRGSLGAAVSLNHQESEFGNSTTETDYLTVNASLGYFFTDHIEINFSPFITSMESDSGNGNETTSIYYSYLGNLKFNFYGEGWTVVPYIGVQGGISGYDAGDNNSDDNFGYGGMGGLKIFFNESVSMNLELNYMQTEFDEDQTQKDTRFFVGFTYYFGGK